jgi:excisionase family DNA binding protein
MPDAPPLTAPVDDPAIGPPEVAALTGLSVPTVYKMVRDRRLPAPLAISRRRLRWRRSTITAWLDSLAAAAKGGR